jgi:hypothetical protein
LTWCGRDLAVVGRHQEALALLGRVKTLGGRKPIDRYNLAVLCVGVGEKELVLQLLEQGSRDRSRSMAQLRLDFSQPLGSDPHFQDLLRPMKFPN